VAIDDQVKVFHPTRHKIGHFEDVLASQSLGLVLEWQFMDLRCTAITKMAVYFTLQSHLQ